MSPPRKAKDELFNAEVRLLFREEDRDLVRRAASLKGLSVSAWARLHLVPTARREVAEAEHELEQLGRRSRS